MNVHEDTPSAASVEPKSAPDGKREYKKPVLKTHGLVKKLTQGSGSFAMDGGQSRGSPKF